MTRAQGKLILTGMRPKRDAGQQLIAGDYEKLDFSTRMDARCPWDWVLPALASYGDRYPLQIIGLGDRMESEQEKQTEILSKKRLLIKELEKVDAKVYAKAEEKLSWQYPYAKNEAFKQKVSVSEIKHRAMEEVFNLLEEDTGQNLFREEIPVPYIPGFVKEQEENRGALRGTAFHRFLECLDFADPSWDYFSNREDDAAKSGLEAYIRKLLADGLMVKSETDLLSTEKLYRFLSNETAERMMKSAKKNLLRKEQPFVMTLPASRIWNETDSQQPVLVQGIIDVFWEEEDGIVLLDYKTDRVHTAQELVLRYQEQLQLYAEALERRFVPKRVKEILMYSFRLDQVIPIEKRE